MRTPPDYNERWNRNWNIAIAIFVLIVVIGALT